MYTISDLIKGAWADFLNDKSPTYLWSDERLNIFANDAIKEACQRAPILIRDRAIPIIAGTSSYALLSTDRQILSAQLSLSNKPLIQQTEDRLAQLFGGSYKTQNNTSSHYSRLNRTLTLFPNPIVNDTLNLTVVSLPDATFNLDTDIDPQYYLPLQYWIAYKAYLLHDADADNLARANYFLGKFEEAFGVRHSAKYDTVNFNVPMYSTIAGGRMC